MAPSSSDLTARQRVLVAEARAARPIGEELTKQPDPAAGPVVALDLGLPRQAQSLADGAALAQPLAAASAEAAAQSAAAAAESDKGFVHLIQGDSSHWAGPTSDVDLVLCNPYAALPPQLHATPAILSLYERRGSRKVTANLWAGGTGLYRIGAWGRGGFNTVYVARLPIREIELGDLVEDEQIPGHGWFPLELPLRLLQLYFDFARPGMTVWDGFMGRGTTGAAARQRGLNFIGIDRDPERVARARQYLAS